MTVEYRVDRSQSLVCLTLSDPLDANQIAEFVHELTSDSDLEPGMNILSDHTGLEFTPTTAVVKTIPRLIDQIAERLGPFRCALVVPSDASFGMARMMEGVSAGSLGEIRAFRTLEEAELWLDVSPAA